MYFENYLYFEKPQILDYRLYGLFLFLHLKMLECLQLCFGHYLLEILFRRGRLVLHIKTGLIIMYNI